MIMVVESIAALVAAGYICAVPLCVELDVRIGEVNRVRVWLGAFGRARVIPIDVPLALPSPRKKRNLIAPGAASRGIRSLIRRTEFERASVTAHISDAHVTALVVGGLGAVLRAVFKKTAAIPDFTADHTYARLSCIASIKLGQVIMAVLSVALYSMKWRFDQWISGRLRGSWRRRWSRFATWWT